MRIMIPMGNIVQLTKAQTSFLYLLYMPQKEDHSDTFVSNIVSLVLSPKLLALQRMYYMEYMISANNNYTNLP